MKRNYPVGIQNFEEIRKGNYYYIDKTELVYQLYIYVMEFKLDGTAEEALTQINDKQYAVPFATDSKKVFKIGVNFSKRTRGIEKWIEAVSK